LYELCVNFHILEDDSTIINVVAGIINLHNKWSPHVPAF
jgi:hypothetical protein